MSGPGCVAVIGSDDPPSAPWRDPPSTMTMSAGRNGHDAARHPQILNGRSQSVAAVPPAPTFRSVPLARKQPGNEGGLRAPPPHGEPRGRGQLLFYGTRRKCLYLAAPCQLGFSVGGNGPDDELVVMAETSEVRRTWPLVALQGPFRQGEIRFAADGHASPAMIV